MQNLQEQMGSFEIGLRVVNWEILILGGTNSSFHGSFERIKAKPGVLNGLSFVKPFYPSQLLMSIPESLTPTRRASGTGSLEHRLYTYIRVCCVCVCIHMNAVSEVLSPHIERQARHSALENSPIHIPPRGHACKSSVFRPCLVLSSVVGLCVLSSQGDLSFYTRLKLSEKV